MAVPRTSTKFTRVMAFGGVLGDNDPKPITGDPKKKSQRRVSPQIVQTYTHTTDKPPLAMVEETDPIFYNQNEFNSYYRKKAVSKMTPEQLEMYNELLPIPGGADDAIRLHGGIPDFSIYQNAVRDYEKTQITNPTDWANLDSQASNYTPSGYRYKKGKPDVESITVPRRQFGGTIDSKPKYTQENIDAARDIRRVFQESYVPPDYSRTPWLDPDRQWLGGDMPALGKGEDLYIDDAGNLKMKPKKRAQNPLFAAPIAQQDATRVSRPVRTKFNMNNGGKFQGPSHEQNGILAVDPIGRPVAEVEGGERLFSVEDSQELESMIKGPMTIGKAARLGKRVKQMIELQDRR